MTNIRGNVEVQYLGEILDNIKLPFDADSITTTYNEDNNPTQVVYKKQNVTVMTINITNTGTNPTDVQYIPS
jgi:uncharacterized protein YjiK